MALNFNQLAMLQKLRSSVQTFRNNHPKFPLFLNLLYKVAFLTSNSLMSSTRKKR